MQEDILPDIIKIITNKTSLKLKLFEKLKVVFNQLRETAEKVLTEIKSSLPPSASNVMLELINVNDFYFRMRIGGETLSTIMHSNIHMLPPHHYMWNTSYLKENPLNAFCGLIYIYNFLNDSFLYNREEDSGELITRIYINHELHFFTEGKTRMDFIFSDFAGQVINKETLRNIILNSILCALSYDLLVPELNLVSTTTVGTINKLVGSSYVSTTKHLGFKLKGSA